MTVSLRHEQTDGTGCRENGEIIVAKLEFARAHVDCSKFTSGREVVGKTRAVCTQKVGSRSLGLRQSNPAVALELMLSALQIKSTK